MSERESEKAELTRQIRPNSWTSPKWWWRKKGKRKVVKIVSLAVCQPSVEKIKKCQLWNDYTLPKPKQAYHIQTREAPSPLSFTPRKRRALLACFFSFLYSSGVVLSAINGKTLRRGLRVLTGFSWWKMSVWIDIQRTPSPGKVHGSQSPHSQHVNIVHHGPFTSVKRIVLAFFVAGCIV